MQDKRKFKRLREAIPVRQRSQESKTIELTQAKNISAGGLCIATDMPLDIGSKLNIEVNVPRSLRPYYAQGEVVWLKETNGSGEKEFDVGVKFLRIISKNDLEGFLSSQEGEYSLLGKVTARSIIK